MRSHSNKKDGDPSLGEGDKSPSLFSESAVIKKELLLNQSAEAWANRHIDAIHRAWKEYELFIGTFANAGVISPEKRFVIDTMIATELKRYEKRLLEGHIDLDKENFKE